ncbi:MAG: rhodanese-like domain-containing protein [Thermoanaerobaculia bacterium]
MRPPQTLETGSGARRIFCETVILVGLALILATISNLTARPERRLDWIGRARVAVPAQASGESAAEPAATDFPPHPDRPYVEITPEQAKRLFDRKALFLDARRTDVYRSGHIAGARSMSVWEAGLDAKLLALSQEGLDPAKPLVAYCSGGDCEDSHQLAERLWSIGFNNVLVYRDGYPDWEKRGWPVEVEAKK